MTRNGQWQLRRHARSVRPREARAEVRLWACLVTSAAALATEAWKKRCCQGATRKVKADGILHVSPCWLHSCLILDFADSSPPASSPRRGTAHHVLQLEHPTEWPRGSPAKHAHELQPDAPALAAGANAPRRPGRSSESPSTSHWCDASFCTCLQLPNTDAPNRLWRGIQCYTAATAAPAECIGRRTGAVCPTHPPRGPSAASLPDVFDASGHGRQYVHLRSLTCHRR